ncbi:MAG TPA: aminodeoxychorismate lyase [Steroidobacteraceae bacterium]|nr:aminodeoxychorismate lyase [Steroidobacteraceae bacterium]
MTTPASGAPLAVLVDGEASAAEWTLDRGLHYGDGLFETIGVRDGQLRFEALHQTRLTEGCARLSIEVDLERLWQQARSLAARHPSCTLKLLISRGSATARGYAPGGTERARVLLFAYAANAGPEVPARVSVTTLRAVLGENPQLAGIKHCNRLEQVLARTELRSLSGAFEGLMASSSGHLISGTMSNVFLEQDGILMTPRLDRCGVAGVMRAVVLREAAQAGLAVRVDEIALDVLQRCDGLFLTNARIGVLPVRELDGRPLAISTAVQELARRVNALAR